MPAHRQALLAFLRLAFGALVAGVGLPAVAQQDYATPYTFSTFAGISSVGVRDGTGRNARFNQPYGLARDRVNGTLYVADWNNHAIRKIAPDGTVSIFAGSPGNPGSTDGTGSSARFFAPMGVAVDAAGNVLGADTQNHTVRRITPAGVVSTVAGAAGMAGSIDGSASSARFNY